MAELYTETITSMSAVFTPAAGCPNSWTYEGADYNSVEGGLLIQNLNYGDFDTACWPPQFGMYGRAPSSIQVYSPGACPSGYETPGQFNNEGTTTAICCPASFSYGSTYSSINNFGSSSVLFMGCISSFSGTTAVPMRTDNTDLATTTLFATSSLITMWGQPITIEYQQKDVSLFGSATSSSSSSSTSTAAITDSSSSVSTTASLSGSSAAQSSVSSTSTSSTSSTSSSSLSTGAKAGIGVGVGILAVILVAVAAFFFTKRRQSHIPTYETDSKEPWRKPGVHVSELPPHSQSERRELDGNETQVHPTNGLPEARYDGRVYEVE